MVKISVILPVYNVENYLRQCLESLVNQSFSEVEFICVNDGSTDRSAVILEEYAQKDFRFVIINQQNQGQGAARNTGIEAANGEYIVFTDPDDWMEKEALEKIYNCFKRNNAEVVQYDYREYCEQTRRIRNINFAEFLSKKFNCTLGNNEYYNWKYVFIKGFKYSKFTVWSKAYSRKFIERYNIKFPLNKQGEDDVFSAQVFFHAPKIYYLQEYLYFYRLRKNSSVNSLSNEHFCIFDNVNLTEVYLKKSHLYKYLKKSFSKYRIEVISRHYLNIPQESRKKYKLRAKEALTRREYARFLFKTANGNSFAESIFSLKNERKDAIKYKVLTVLGLKFKMIPKMNGGIQ